jgi:hypothetical protein
MLFKTGMGHRERCSGNIYKCLCMPSTCIVKLAVLAVDCLLTQHTALYLDIASIYNLQEWLFGSFTVVQKSLIHVLTYNMFLRQLIDIIENIGKKGSK